MVQGEADLFIFVSRLPEKETALFVKQFETALLQVITQAVMGPSELMVQGKAAHTKLIKETKARA